MELCSVKYIIHIRNCHTYMTVFIHGDSFPTAHEINKCLRRDIKFDCLRIFARRICLSGRRYDIQCRDNECINEPVWNVIPRPRGYDVEYPFESQILEFSILHRMFGKVAIVARSDGEMLIAFIVSPEQYEKWWERFSEDYFGYLTDDCVSFENMKLANLVLAARILNVNITLQVYTRKIKCGDSMCWTDYTLQRSIYISRDANFVQPLPPLPYPGDCHDRIRYVGYLPQPERACCKDSPNCSCRKVRSCSSCGH